MQLMNHPASHSLVMNLAIIIGACVTAWLLQNPATLLALAFMQAVPAYDVSANSTTAQGEFDEEESDYGDTNMGFMARIK